MEAVKNMSLDDRVRAFLSLERGDGSGSGSGDGDGDGSGDGGLAEINGRKVYLIDEAPTILVSVHGNVAKGFILQFDLNITPCFVVKGNNVFAHGDDLHDAMRALTDKTFDNLPEADRIAAFIKEHPDKDALYTHKDLYDWHHRLTGSCVAGRNAFAKDHGIDMEGSSTVTYFIELTKNAYGGSIIKKLAEAYKEKEKET